MGNPVPTDVEHDPHELSPARSSRSTASSPRHTMSNKLSTTEIIAQGDYLEPDFNPSALTVAHLLGILGYHNVKYPSQYTKSKLVEIFNDEIKPKASRFKSERLSRQNSQASDEGIKDGITGRAIGGKSVRINLVRFNLSPSVY